MRTHRIAARTRRSAAALLMIGFTFTTACDQLLGVTNPSAVPDDLLSDPTLMPALAAGAIQTFQCGAMQFAVTGGMLAGEYWSSNGFVNNHTWEWRSIADIKNSPGSCNYGQGTTSMGFYTPLQQARFQLDDAFARFDKFSDAEIANRAKLMAEFRAEAGYALVLLAEGMCEMTIDGGPSMTKAQVLAIAKDRFNDALTRATAVGDASLQNMALVGLARAALDDGDMAGAATAARQVTTNFVRNLEFSTSVQSRENRIYDLNVLQDFLSVPPAYQNLTVMVQGQADPQPDPRVPVKNMGKLANDGVTPYWQQLKFASGGGVGLPIASWAEAQLILAEAVGGQEGLDAVNAVRATKNIQPLVPLPTDDWTTLVLEERRRQLYSEGQRYGDMLRKNLPFQTGTNRKGQIYSSLTCVPLPNVEIQNNPNFQ
ncbi:MAG TPA: RagB/SusD family nutrient uptake outer membrane protein [Vicinamibacterales bacterium]